MEGERPRVLLVEDDAGLRDARRLLLKVEGYRVTAVASFEEALVTASAGIDLLIASHYLGGGRNGINVISALQGKLGPRLPAIPVTYDPSKVMRTLFSDTNVRVVRTHFNGEELLLLLRNMTAILAPGTFEPLERNIQN